MKYKLINIGTREETLCDKVVIDGFDYYVDDFISYEVNGDLTEIPFEKLILVTVATNNPNIDIPKVVDEVEVPDYAPHFKELWLAGYNKSQETHPFSEEDMIEFLDFESNWLLTNKYRNAATNYKPYGIGRDISRKELLQLWKEQRPKIIYYEQ